MKRTIITLLILSVLLMGCSKTPKENDLEKKPNFTGVVEEITESSILIKVSEGQDEAKSSDLIYVSLKAELEDSEMIFESGDKVRVYYDGTIAESYPAQINNVYGIYLE